MKKIIDDLNGYYDEEIKYNGVKYFKRKFTNFVQTNQDGQ